MKKKHIIIIVSVAAFLVIGFNLFMMYTKSHSPEDHVAFIRNGLEVKVDYCQPQKKGRDVFGGLVPYGKVWRTGANAATLVTFNKDVTFGTKTLKAGQYSLYTIPNKASWTFIFNEEVGQWGTEYNKEKNVLKINAIAEELDKEVEKFTIRVIEDDKKVLMVLTWDKTMVALPIASL